MPTSHLFKVVFHNQGKVFEIYARKVGHGNLFGFVEVEELNFRRAFDVVVDPAEEKIKAEFEGVKRTYLPLHSVIRIDEVRKSGVSKVSAVDSSNVTPFPFPVYTPATPGHGASSSRAGSFWPVRARSGIIARPGQTGGSLLLMLTLSGAPRVSDFRLAKLLAAIRDRVEHVHAARLPLSALRGPRA